MRTQPNLRFPEFVEPWNTRRLESLVERVSSPASIAEQQTYREIGIRSHGKGIFHKQPCTGKSLGSKRVFHVASDALVINIVFAWEQALGITSPKEDGFIASHRFPMFRAVKTSTYLPFIRHLLLTKAGRSMLERSSPGGAGRNRTLNLKDFLRTEIRIPCVNEQRKIADFLTAVDTKIDLLRQQKELFETYKKGLMQRLFSQEIRFKADDGSDFPDWEFRKLNDVVIRVKDRCRSESPLVLTISGIDGLTPQTKYFNKSIASKDLSSYYVVKQGDFAYNKSSSSGYPMGAIKRLSRHDSGVVSPLYICFRSKRPEDADFLEHFFESGGLNSQLESIAQEGARNHGLLNVSVTAFFDDMEVPTPCEAEQRKIASACATLDERIQLSKDTLESMSKFKAGLLQQMFA